MNSDAANSRAKAEEIKFEYERLTRAIPLLEAALLRAQEREHAARWSAEYERIEAKRDELAAELTALYPSLVRQLVELFARIAECDKAVGRINLDAPSGERRRLLGVELAARGLDQFTASDPSIFDRLQLPNPGNSRSLVYPPEQGNPLGLLMASAAAAVATKHAAAYGPDWAAVGADQLAEAQREADKRQAEIDKQEREAKRKFERDLVEGHRARRVGRKQEA
ncbi:MAG: hypothetical protein U1E81_14815 [Xanthobacteraceae bacterium]